MLHPFLAFREFQADFKVTEFHPRIQLAIKVEVCVVKLGWFQYRMLLFSFPNILKVALRTTNAWLTTANNHQKVDRIIFACFRSEEMSTYEELLPQFFPFSKAKIIPPPPPPPSPPPPSPPPPSPPPPFSSKETMSTFGKSCSPQHSQYNTGLRQTTSSSASPQHGGSSDVGGKNLTLWQKVVRRDNYSGKCIGNGIVKQACLLKCLFFHVLCCIRPT